MTTTISSNGFGKFKIDNLDIKVKVLKIEKGAVILEASFIDPDGVEIYTFEKRAVPTSGYIVFQGLNTGIELRII